MAAVQSVAFSIFSAAGAVFDPPGKTGTANVLTDVITRGAGERDSEQLTMELDRLGLQRNEHAGSYHLSFTGATVAQNLAPSLRVYADILLRPLLDADEVPPAVAGVRQSLRAVEDEPRQKVMVELKRRCYPLPWGLPAEGVLEDLDRITAADVRQHFRDRISPHGLILAVAGRCDPTAVLALVQELFGDWQGRSTDNVPEVPAPVLPSTLEQDSSQTHIGIAYGAVPYRHEKYYEAWAAAGVLSGGMSSRLFTHVREERGLCYSIGASLHAVGPHGRVLCYAGTTVERAQETLDVTIAELVRLQDGISEEELDRCKARAKSSLIMQQESTLARSTSLARDWFHLGRVVTLEEVRQRIESLTVDGVLSYVRAYPAANFSIVTIGPQPLELPHGLS